MWVNLLLIGPMGAGKSTIGYYLSKILNVEFFDTDKAIEKITGINIKFIFKVEGENGFRKIEEHLIKSLIKRIIFNKGIVVSTGGGLITARNIRKIIYKKVFLVYLKTNILNQLYRTITKLYRPLLNFKIKKNEILKIIFNERNILYKNMADIIIGVDNLEPKLIINKIIKIINNLNKINK